MPVTIAAAVVEILAAVPVGGFVAVHGDSGSVVVAGSGSTLVVALIITVLFFVVCVLLLQLRSFLKSQQQGQREQWTCFLGNICN